MCEQVLEYIVLQTVYSLSLSLSLSVAQIPTMGSCVCRQYVQ